ncbi:B-box zinc finger family protein [Striga asiatica]|uniref:B-box zinc finger family protein n=1 Tax=Striga asiatica TaxID=4170 RepID=A0A5A7RGT9_STRAF|nr:B-box zinc finger family protein [Striga asiatica]
MVACDFCGQRAAILYCRADTAKLCLSCDQHVHSANALSRKHLRSQICDNCASGPASVRCATDGLVLCQECDWDAHGSCAVSAAHDRCPLEGFSGCPSPLDLAAAWGLEIENKGPPPSDEWGGLLGELMVPNVRSAVYSDCGSLLVKKRKSPTCGKQKQVILKQLLELLADSGNAECGEEVGPRTPSGGGWRPESVCEEQQLLEEKEQPQQQENGSFTSLLMMETKEEVNNNSSQWISLLISILLACHLCLLSVDLLSKIWDFNLGKLRSRDESGDLELEYDVSDMLYTVKSYGELLKEAPLSRRRGLDLSEIQFYLGKIYPGIPVVSCEMVLTKFIVCLSLFYTLVDSLRSSCYMSEVHGSMVFGIYNIMISMLDSITCLETDLATRVPMYSIWNGLSMGRNENEHLSFSKPKSGGSSKDPQFTDQSILVRSEHVSAMTNADLELLAKNRDNAMQRYKEKKKARRYDKHIRYESRKARADTRKRVKGRFVKASETSAG